MLKSSCCTYFTNNWDYLDLLVLVDLISWKKHYQESPRYQTFLSGGHLGSWSLAGWKCTLKSLLSLTGLRIYHFGASISSVLPSRNSKDEVYEIYDLISNNTGGREEKRIRFDIQMQSWLWHKTHIYPRKAKYIFVIL